MPTSPPAIKTSFFNLSADEQRAKLAKVYCKEGQKKKRAELKAKALEKAPEKKPKKVVKFKPDVQVRDWERPKPSHNLRQPAAPKAMGKSVRKFVKPRQSVVKTKRSEARPPSNSTLIEHGYQGLRVYWSQNATDVILSFDCYRNRVTGVEELGVGSQKIDFQFSDKQKVRTKVEKAVKPFKDARSKPKIQHRKLCDGWTRSKVTVKKKIPEPKPKANKTPPLGVALKPVNRGRWTWGVKLLGPTTAWKPAKWDEKLWKEQNNDNLFRARGHLHKNDGVYAEKNPYQFQIGIAEDFDPLEAKIESMPTEQYGLMYSLNDLRKNEGVTVEKKKTVAQIGRAEDFEPLEAPKSALEPISETQYGLYNVRSHLHKNDGITIEKHQTLAQIGVADDFERYNEMKKRASQLGVIDKKAYGLLYNKAEHSRQMDKDKMVYRGTGAHKLHKK